MIMQQVPGLTFSLEVRNNLKRIIHDTLMRRQCVTGLLLQQHHLLPSTAKLGCIGLDVHLHGCWIHGLLLGLKQHDWFERLLALGVLLALGALRAHSWQLHTLREVHMARL